MKESLYVESFDYKFGQIRYLQFTAHTKSTFVYRGS